MQCCCFTTLAHVGPQCVLSDILVRGVRTMMRCNLPLMVATNARRRMHFKRARGASPAPMCSLAKCICRFSHGTTTIAQFTINAMTQSGVIPPLMMAPSNGLGICQHFSPTWITRLSDRHGSSIIILQHPLQTTVLSRPTSSSHSRKSYLYRLPDCPPCTNL